MSQVVDHLNAVTHKTTRLINICAVLQDENDLLRIENRRLKESFDASNSQNAELQEMIRVLKLARSLEGMAVTELELDEKTLDIKQKISKFVNEIDKCIVLLKKQY